MLSVSFFFFLSIFEPWHFGFLSILDGMVWLGRAERLICGLCSENCELFSVPFESSVDGTSLVIKSQVSGIWFYERGCEVSDWGQGGGV